MFSGDSRRKKFKPIFVCVMSSNRYVAQIPFFIIAGMDLDSSLVVLMGISAVRCSVALTFCFYVGSVLLCLLYVLWRNWHIYKAVLCFCLSQSVFTIWLKRKRVMLVDIFSQSHALYHSTSYAWINNRYLVIWHAEANAFILLFV